MPDLLAENNCLSKPSADTPVGGDTTVIFEPSDISSTVGLTDVDIVASNNDINAAINGVLASIDDDKQEEIPKENSEEKKETEDENERSERITSAIIATDGLVETNKLRDKLAELNDSSNTPKIYDDIYEDFTSTITRKKVVLLQLLLLSFFL